jgi:trehalose synthase-fused probable maltokinase
MTPHRGSPHDEIPRLAGGSPGTGAELALALDEAALSEWLLGRRWFASKAREVAHVHVLDAVVLADGDPGLVVACVEARFQGGTHELYQLLLAMRPADSGWERDVVAQSGGQTLYEAMADPEAGALLGELLRARAEVEGSTATVSFHWIEGSAPAPGEESSVRPMGAEQSNSSLVFDDALVLKAYRRVEAGVNPELEMLRFLSERDFPNIALLGGWYDYRGELMDATFGVVQRYVAEGRDGWEFALDEIGREPEVFLEQLHELGRVIARMHTVLGSDASDPAFAPEDPSEETLSLLTATIDEQIEQVFLDLPSDDPAVEPISGRGEEVRDRLRLLSTLGAGGKIIRHHGDLHLGQTLLAPDGWVILDFEGEPARPLLERRRKRSPLRDVAGMLRSFAYAASASELQRGVPAPEGWEERARSEFLTGYFETVDPSLLPPGQNAARTLLSMFELEKAVYELRYELNNRPDWVSIPVAGIARLLEEEETG